MKKIKRVFIECTSTYKADFSTGVQRVVRNIIKEAKNISKELNVEFYPVIFKYNGFLKINKIQNTIKISNPVKSNHNFWMIKAKNT